jgi:hypothetical protein
MRDLEYIKKKSMIAIKTIDNNDNNDDDGNDNCYT